MKRSGTCPKCTSHEVYSNANLGRGNRNLIKGTNLLTDTYICLSCGYYEDYIQPDILNDPKQMDYIRSKWDKS